uniref:protein-tyrosine-phosphatase n=2 Tax=Guillardia theta TaxID=55529 RepID=A0A7S4NNX9_GUITH|mmetsp:Transcript_28054/g.90986  ORF Transcript_28054/g.90986 Transcript_28054/m.90986 type:complete len:605 (+) Transcript_28054:266-2080(+)
MKKEKILLEPLVHPKAPTSMKPRDFSPRKVIEKEKGKEEEKISLVEDADTDRLELDSLSQASTPSKHKEEGSVCKARIAGCEEEFVLGSGSFDGHGKLEILKGRLFLKKYRKGSKFPSQTDGRDVHMCVPARLRYFPFCADFGPFNLGTTITMLRSFEDKLRSGTQERITLFVEDTITDVTNGMYLIGSFLCVSMGLSPSEAWIPFAQVSPWDHCPFRDATWAPSTFNITLRDCWAGLQRAMEQGLLDPSSLDVNEYFYYESPWNGDMHEVVKGKFIAFRGPKGSKMNDTSFIPSDFELVFHAKNVTRVIRLNENEYRKEEFEEMGIKHTDLFFVDCSTPSDAIVDKFLKIAEKEKGVMAVHCFAGLGRTGTLIATYLMKHRSFTAREAIAWLRICRPGSVIGPQQQFLELMEEKLKRLGEDKVPGLGLSDHATSPLRLRMRGARERLTDAVQSAELADMVSNGMRRRELERVHDGEEGHSPANNKVEEEEEGELKIVSHSLSFRSNPTPTPVKAGKASLLPKVRRSQLPERPSAEALQGLPARWMKKVEPEFEASVLSKALSPSCRAPKVLLKGHTRGELATAPRDAIAGTRRREGGARRPGK